MSEFKQSLMVVLNEVGKSNSKFVCSETGDGMEIKVTKKNSAIYITVKSNGTVNLSYQKDLLQGEMGEKHEYDYLSSATPKKDMTLRVYSPAQLNDFINDFNKI